MPRRSKQLDYRILNSTGEKVLRDTQNITSTSPTDSSSIKSVQAVDSMADKDPQTKITNNRAEALILMEEIDDLIEENPHDQLSVEDAKIIISKLDEKRALLRRLQFHRSLEDEEDKMTSLVMSKLSSVRDYMKASTEYKNQKQRHNEKASKELAASKERSTLFIIEDVQRTIGEVRSEIETDLGNASDHQLIQMQNNFKHISAKIDKVAQKYELLLLSPIINAEKLIDIQDIGNRYMKLTKDSQVYHRILEKVIEERDIHKQRSFDESKLNICLEKFSGYDSSTDIFTFQSTFNKLYLQSTPKRMLPDLLKNNLLKGSALTLVKSLNNIDQIWKSLKSAYGDTKLLLAKQLQKLSNNNSLQRTKDPEQLVQSLGDVINIMKELMKLAKDHQIEESLFYGDGLDRIYNNIGDARLTRWLTSIADENLVPKATWLKFITFLEKEQKLQQQKMLILQPKSTKVTEIERTKHRPPPHRSYMADTPQNQATCSICSSPSGMNDHIPTNGPAKTQLIQYFTCQKFTELTPADRFSMLRKKGFCIQCLYPGADGSVGRHKEGRCQRDFVCPHESHLKFPVRKHVLICDEHKDSPANQRLLENFKQRCMKHSTLPTFAKNISISFHATFHCKTPSSGGDIHDKGIYLLQNIFVNNCRLNMFYDNGCSDFIVKKSTIDSLGRSATKISSEPVQLGGVGETSTRSTLGTYNVKLPMYNGRDASLTGICIKSITSTFPTYPLTEVMTDIQNSFNSSGHAEVALPKPSSSVGGEIHLMLGVKYLRYHPRLIYQLPSGLGIYESVFVNADGGRGVIGGPHHIFTTIHNSFFNASEASNFFSHQHKLFSDGLQIDPEVKMLTFQTHQKRFEASEMAGSEITYRCTKCRSCKACKNSDHQLDVSIKEEAEQEIIDQSIKIDLDSRSITATLPFIKDPKTNLAPNKDIAVKIYNQQLKRLNQKDKEDIISSEKKMHKLGFVDFVENLSPEQQTLMKESSTQNYIPWRAVWKLSSISTPCRIVFDASHPTRSGTSLNDILAKGTNNLNKLQEILLRWSIRRVGLHTDVSKMYNTVKLDPSHWPFQRYIWHDELDPTKTPHQKVIKTLIYGVRSSGNQAVQGLRQIAEIHKEEYPLVSKIIKDDVYVDDCITGDDNYDAAFKRADELEVVTGSGSFNLKGITISGKDPPSHLTEDGTSVGVGGMRWYSKSDEISLCVPELNFSTKQRGKKSMHATNVIPTVLTRRHCASKVAEVFDITGKISPIVAAMKLDLRELVDRQLSWDDAIPDDLRPVWLSHFDMMQEISQIRFNRVIVPEDAISLDLETLDFGDSSKSMICVCIYARFQRANGGYSCQLVFSRTRTVPKDMSLPRAELYASLINTHTGEIVQRAFKDHFKSATKFTDSQITLYWITNDQKSLKPWIRNRVIEINRFASKDTWFYVKSKDMAADIGTRRGATVEDVNHTSTWINGLPWMSLKKSEFPALTAQQITLTNMEIAEINKESQIFKEFQAHLSQKVNEKVKLRYEFSHYILDPNRHSFPKVLRILSYVQRFCRNLQSKVKDQQAENITKRISPISTTEEISSAKSYYYRKGAAEIKHFLRPSKYEDRTKESDGILVYTGRVLPNQNVSIVGQFTSTMKDLSSTSFCVPVLERCSPIAYSIVMDVHWNHPNAKHAGIETTHRFVLQRVYIIEGRQLVKEIRDSCERCRYLMKRTVDIAMGPVKSCNLTIAPAFFYSQVDLSGPYLSYSPQHKRTTVKIWLVVFCCCSTSAVSIKVMDDYSTTAFVMAFKRFSCQHGFPKRVLSDEGSQLVKGFTEMRISYRDVKSQLMMNKQVQFEVCPVQGHNMHGKVERKIREINQSIETTLQNNRLSLLQWETLASTIANSINNLPLSLGNISGDFEVMDLITPNRLLLGRNNERSPDGTMVCFESSPSKILRENTKVYQCWFETWLLVHVPRLMNQQKWFKSDVISVGDVVIFTKVDSIVCKSYTYGMVVELQYGDDNLPRKAKIRYRNSSEEKSRETFRAVRGLIIIHHVDESDIMTELGLMAKSVDLDKN